MRFPQPLLLVLALAVPVHAGLQNGPIDYETAHLERRLMAVHTYGAIRNVSMILRHKVSAFSELPLLPELACQAVFRSRPRSPLTIGQAQTPLQLISKNTILGNEVFVAQEQFSIDRSRDARQH